jgi:hypothetical protein
MGTFHDLVAKIAALPDASFRVFHSGKRPPSEAELASLEARIGRPLAPAYRELLATWGVLFVEVPEEVWPRPVEHEVIPAWRLRYGFKLLGIGESLPPALSIEGARTPELDALGALPFLRREGFPGLVVSTPNGLASWRPGHAELEPLERDEIDWILLEIADLEDGVSKLRSAESDAASLVEAARAAGFEGPGASDALEALEKRPSAELAPHVVELARGFLVEDASQAMGCLDVLAAAGRDAFPAVAEYVYDHYGRSDDPYVLELLGRMCDASPRAIELYAEGLRSDDDDTRSYAVKAVHAVAELPLVRTLLGTVDELLDGGEVAGEAKLELVTLAGALGSPRFFERASAALSGAASDADFAMALRVLSKSGPELSSLETALLTRFAAMAPSERYALEAVEALAALGMVDLATMQPVVANFRARGGNWAKRADNLAALLGG